MIIERIKKNKACPQCLKHSFSRRGFVLLFAVTLAAILLTIALGVANIALKEVKFSTDARDTNDAFFAADTGTEYALFKDKNPLNYPAPGNWDETITGLGSVGKNCAKVHITKTTSPAVTKIVSKGYDIGDISCASSNPDRTEREIDTTY